MSYLLRTNVFINVKQLMITVYKCYVPFNIVPNATHST